MFTIGSFGIAVCAVLLLVAVVARVLLDRAVSSNELLVAVLGSCVARIFLVASYAKQVIAPSLGG